MKKSFKRVLSVILSVILVFSVSATAFAADEDVTPVIVVSGMGAYPLVNEDGTNAFPVSTDVMVSNIAQAVLPAIGSMVSDDFSMFNEYGTKSIFNIFEPISCDKDGNSVHNVTGKTFPGCAIQYKEVFEERTSNESHMVCAVADKVGWENTYYMYYDWRQNPLSIADTLDATVKQALSETGSDKVSLYAISFGGMITLSYMYKYGTDNIKNIVFSSTAFQGVEMVGKLFSNMININISEALDYFAGLASDIPFIAGLLGISADVLPKYGTEATVFIDKYLQHMEDEISLDLFTDVFAETFAHFKGMWAMVPADYYEGAKAFVKSACPMGETFFDSVDEYIYNVQAKAKELIDEAQNEGVNVYITGGYGYSEIPVTEGKSRQTDDLIETYLMTGGATVALYGETLQESDYVKESLCTEHNHKSTDGVIDASTAILPEQTWFVKNMKHVDLQENYETSSLGLWLLMSDERLTVHSSEKYPQFVELDRETGRFVSLTEGVTLAERTTVDFGDIFSKLLAFIEMIIAKFVK